MAWFNNVTSNAGGIPYISSTNVTVGAETVDIALGELRIPCGVHEYSTVKVKTFKSDRFCGIKNLDYEIATDERAGGTGGGVAHHACTAYGDALVDVAGVKDTG